MISTGLLMALAFAPGIYLAIIIYGKDKYEPEPKKILLAAFILGALSVFPAGLIEILLAKPMDFEELGLANVGIHAFIVVGLTEELLKFLIIRFHAFRKPSFNEPFDGIIYAVFVGLGFATLENVFYVMEGGWSVAIMRMFTSVPAHYAFAVIMGYYMGKAKFEPEKRGPHLLKAIAYPTLIHGAYDFFILQGDYPALGLLTVGVLLLALRISKKAVDELQADSIFRFHSRQIPDQTAPNESGKI